MFYVDCSGILNEGLITELRKKGYTDRMSLPVNVNNSRYLLVFAEDGVLAWFEKPLGDKLILKSAEVRYLPKYQSKEDSAIKAVDTNNLSTDNIDELESRLVTALTQRMPGVGTDFQKECLRILPFVIAGAQGSKIECLLDGSHGWFDCAEGYIATDGCYYRITPFPKVVPSPKYRPYKTIDEAERDRANILGSKIISKFLNVTRMILSLSYEDSQLIFNDTITAAGMLRDYTFADGSPVGIEAKE